MDDDYTIVCAPADAPLAPIGSVFHHACGACGGKVMMAPSGQAFLRKHPLAAIRCLRCQPIAPRDYRPPETASLDTVLEEMRTAGPNLRRSRN
jgi:hypothetical protein